ncbi:hypothetical protein EIP86_005004 [Pleurotus ostreatoroseus]|nr:hypothetical protein EIP86_005004 [Pleurotus ostreatoroseus]
MALVYFPKKFAERRPTQAQAEGPYIRQSLLLLTWLRQSHRVSFAPAVSAKSTRVLPNRVQARSSGGAPAAHLFSDHTSPIWKAFGRRVTWPVRARGPRPPASFISQTCSTPATMKRGAERQLTKDDGDEHTQDADPEQGIQRADRKVLAARPMKGLPRRAGMSNPAPSASTTPSTSVTPEPSAPASKFSGFAGFGANTSAPTPFSFSAPTPPAAPSAPVPSFGGFGSGTGSAFPASTPSSSTSLFSSPPPAVSSTASAATKTFASFLSIPSSSRALHSIPALSEPKQQGSSIFAAPTPKSPEPGPAAAPSWGSNSNTNTNTNTNSSSSSNTTTADAHLKAETTYYTALRGLNHSLLRAAQAAVDADPFCDLAPTLEMYRALRAGARAEFEEATSASSKARTQSQPASSVGKDEKGEKDEERAVGGSPFGKPLAASTTTTATGPGGGFSMPKPPTSFAGFAGFGAAPASTSTSATTSAGFVPTTHAAASSSGTSTKSTSAFSFPAAPSSSSSTSAGGSGGGAFKFGSSAATSTDAGKTDTGGGGGAKSAFAFGASSGTGAGAGANSAPSVFSSNLFGGGESAGAEKEKTEKSDAKDDAKDKDKDKSAETKPAATSLFGAGTGSLSPSPFLFGAPASSSSSTTTPASTSSGAFGGFGKPALGPAAGSGSGSGTGSGTGTPPSPSAGSFGNPVGWQFGSAKQKHGEEAEDGQEKGAEGRTTATARAGGLFGSGAGAGAGSVFGSGSGGSVFGSGLGTGGSVFGSSASPAFTFGAPAASSSLGSGLGSSASTPFSFLPTPAPFSSSTAASVPSASADASSAEGTPAPAEDVANAPVLERGSVHDLAGEGEEDEDTAHEVRSKVYRLVRPDADAGEGSGEGGSGSGNGGAMWRDLGVGLLKVKVHRESGARRVLLRNSSTGKVTLNFNIYKTMAPSVSKNTISFVGHEEGEAVSYRLRVKTNDLAEELKKALDREIEFVKGKAE